MASAPAIREVEVKLAIGPPAEAGLLLRRHGFRVARRRVREINTVFDTPEAALRSANRLLRLRSAGRRHTLTFKGPPEAGKYKSRDEVEFPVASPKAVDGMLRELGFAPRFRYEKFRTEYAQPGSEGVVTVDETPIGNFIELEGGPEWIDRIAGELGFRESDYITASYGSLYLDWCRKKKSRPSDMLFARR